MRLRSWMIVVFLGAAGSVGAEEEPHRAIGSIEWQAVKFETVEGPKQSVDAEEGRLWVAEDWRDPGERVIGLRLVRFRSTAEQPGAPIVYLAGGPGGSGTRSAAGDRFPLFMRLREVADVIALDQRGVLSIPFPTCPTPFRIPFDLPSSNSAVIEAYRAAAGACAQRWSEQGIDLRVFHTENSADDLEALRKALGAERLNLLGISYGTHLLLATVKRHPRLAARAILAGTEGLDATLKLPSRVEAQFERVARLADADPELRAATGGLRAGVERLLEELRAQPRTVRVPLPGGGGNDVVVGPLDVQVAIWDFLNERADIAALPAAIVKALRGDWSTLGQWAGWRRLLPGLLPMAVSTDCASGTSGDRLARIREETPRALLGDVANLPFPEICAGWPHVDLGDAFRSPVVDSLVPALFLSGMLDGRTPPENAEEARRGFANSHHVLIQHGGHDDDLLLSSPAIADWIVAFFKGEAPPADRIELAPIDFERPR